MPGADRRENDLLISDCGLEIQKSQQHPPPLPPDQEQKLLAGTIPYGHPRGTAVQQAYYLTFMLGRIYPSQSHWPQSLC